jgi:hypothetical protein
VVGVEIPEHSGATLERRCHDRFGLPSRTPRRFARAAACPGLSTPVRAQRRDRQRIAQISDALVSVLVSPAATGEKPRPLLERCAFQTNRIRMGYYERSME